MLSSARFRTTSRLAASGLIAASLVLASGCGGDGGGSGEITADTFCDEFMQQPPADRVAGANKVGAKIGVPNPTDPQWIGLLEQRCGAAPDLKLGDFFAHFM